MAYVNPIEMDSQQLSDAIRAAQDGQAESLCVIFEAYSSRLYGYFYQATRCHHDAEDLLSELALRLVKTIGRYDERGRFEPWLFRIAANLVRDRIRRRKANPQPVSISADDQAGQSLSQQLPGNCAAVDANLLAQETSQELQQALNQMDETTRQIILLRYFGDMSFKELAEVFECPIGTVLARVHRGLKSLREMVREK